MWFFVFGVWSSLFGVWGGAAEVGSFVVEFAVFKFVSSAVG